MMDSNSQDFFLKPKGSDRHSESSDADQSPPWIILVVDDNKEVHDITNMVLRNFRFEGRKIRIISAFSGSEAIEILKREPDTALVILDVVMESEHAGLDVAKQIREELDNQLVRIVLRTGQPGQAPEEEVIIEYDINDYKDKSELTSAGLKTMTIAALRNYRDLTYLESNRRGLLNIAQLSSRLFHMSLPSDFKREVLEILASSWPLCALGHHTASNAIWLQKKADEFIAVIGTGRYLGVEMQLVKDLVGPEALDFITEAWAEKANVVKPERSILYIEEPIEGQDYRIYLSGYSASINEEQLVNIVSNNIAVASHNMGLLKELDDMTRVLEMRVLERTREYRKEKTRAEEASHAKSLFLANMSHEIRTPLNAILGFAQLCLRSKNIPQKNREMITSIETAGNHLLEVINDVLELSKIEAGAMELEEDDFLLRQLIDDIAVMFKVRCEQKGLRWKLDYGIPDDLAVRGDAGKIRQILINLLSNAVKFTQHGSVSFKVIESKPEQYLFEVSDTGPGISEKDQELIFDPFKQLSVHTSAGGTGLGLAISRQQVTLLGSELGLKSDKGKGSLFYFSVNLPPAKTEISTRLDPGAAKYRIVSDHKLSALVVDDVDANRQLLSGLLSDLGIEVVVAKNGKEAIESLYEHPIDIVFMDIRMPVMNGDEAVKKIRLDPRFKSLICIAISAYSMAHEVDHYLESGFDRYISKPFRFEEIYQALGDFCGVKFEDNTEETSDEIQTPDFDYLTVKLPIQLRDSLLQAANLNRRTEMRNLIKEVEVIDPGGIALSEYLTQRLNQYDSQSIIDALNAVSCE